MTLCPRCQQGDVVPYVVVGTYRWLQMCDDCDASWPAHTTPDVATVHEIDDVLVAMALDPETVRLAQLRDVQRSDGASSSMNHRWCPFCDQGFVWRFTLQPTGELLQVCCECASTWSAETSLRIDNRADLSSVLAERGLDPSDETVLQPADE